LNVVGIKTKSFQRIVEPFIWNYLVENDMEGKDSIGVPENNAEDKDSIGFLVGPQLTPPARLPIPAGILWIPVFSIPVAFFHRNHDSCSAGKFSEPLGNPVCMGPT